MKIKNIFKSMQGFSLVEVLAAIAVLGVLSTVVMKLMDNANKSAKTIEANDEISQLQRELTDILSNPNNCEATLGEKREGNTVPLVNQVVNYIETPKIIPSAAASKKASIKQIRVKSIDMNGNGSQAIGTLDVTFLKPGSALGGREIKREIKFNANFCEKNYLEGNTNIATCSGAGMQIIQGPHTWGAKRWAICQDCTSAGSNPIMSCQTTGGSGVDVGNISQLSCTSLGGSFDQGTSQCMFSNLTLDEYINKKMPYCIITTDTSCAEGGIFTKEGGTSLMVFTSPPSAQFQAASQTTLRVCCRPNPNVSNVSFP